MPYTPRHFFQIIVVSISLGIIGCANNDTSIPSPATQKRVNQTRSFTAPNQEFLLQTILTTLQDQGYNIVKVNSNNAEITAQRDGDILISIIIYPMGSHLFSVRANAQHFTNNNDFFSNNNTGYEVIINPVFYQTEFFEPLSKSLLIQKENLPNQPISP